LLKNASRVVMMRKKSKALIIHMEPYRSTAKIKKKIIQNKHLPSQECNELIKEIDMIKKILKETPDVREGKIAELRDAIKNGTYVVNSKKIAEKLIIETLLQQNFKSRNRDC
jgi:flagellar biosynthesis anti-sigma factor FlgM